ncbi:ATP-binding cassette domain-containing protein [Myxococcota bacterium]|nr:ATP-binding cassette domain-containing protein [Myxococcota bacterium]
MTTTDTLLRVEGLTTWYPIRRGLMRRIAGHVQAATDVSFEIGRGRTLALVGESGCGKSTVGRSILGLESPRSGRVVFEGRDLLAESPQALRAARQRLQIVFQDPLASLDPRMRIRDQIAEGMRSFGIVRSNADYDRRVAELLVRVQLDPAMMDRYPHEFSGGQRQRLCIARALAVEPRLIVCDESVSALDVSIQAQILNLLTDLQRDLGLSYLFITHDLSVVRYLAHEVAVMYLGRIVEHGPTERIFARPAHPYTRALLASIPSLDPKRIAAQPGTEGPPVLGDVPSPSNPPPGCSFHTRCPRVMDRCRRELPPAYAIDGGTSRCFLSEPGAGRAADPPA